MSDLVVARRLVAAEIEQSRVRLRSAGITCRVVDHWVEGPPEAGTLRVYTLVVDEKDRAKALDVLGLER